ncbi:MAG: PEGA domain-containing protein [Phycisphaerales bacterium]|nr:PEGA domain-containing protein [Phycisphaerales bacterium]
MSAIDPLACERCGRRLESDDAISVIEGVCGVCRNTAQSLVQPKRADEILSRRYADDQADDFLADLPKIEPWQPSPIPSEPWLVEESPVRRERVSSAAANFLDAEDDESPDDDDIDSHAEAPESSGQDEDVDAPMIPPGPFAAVRRRKPVVKDPVEAVSEIFEHGIPPSDLFVTDRDETDSAKRVDIHRFTPPPMDFPQGGPKRRRRKRALTVGVCLGILLTAAAAWLANDKTTRDRALAWIDQMRHVESNDSQPDSVELSILVDPSDAVVRLDGVRLAPNDTTGRIELTVASQSMDERLLEVTAPGYHTITQALSDFRGVDEIVLRLAQRPFEAEIATDPPGAEVFLEGRLVGNSPVQVTIDPEIGAEVVVRKDGFKAITRTLKSPEEGETLKLRMPLEPAGVKLAINTDPVPAQIWVNDRLFGRTPLDVDLDYQFLGKDVEVVARADGYDDARMTIPMPNIGGDEMDASIKLERTMARLNVRTEPAGGRVVLAGRDYGNAPVMVEFDPSETGKQVVIDTSLGGQYFGRQAVTIPSAGGPRECVIPMSFSAQRVVFVIAASRRAQADQYLLADALATRIEQLDASQRFAVLASTDDGIEAWPFEVAFESATSEQKVRAFDMVRSIRSAEHVDLDALFASAVQLDPTTVWLFTETPDRAALEKLSAELEGRDVSINLVTARTMQNDVWLDGYAARHRGVFESLDEAIASNGEVGE